MIASLEGTVGAVGLDSLVVEVGGVGYRVFAAPSLLVLSTPGTRIKVFTHHVVREDAQQLFGFRTVEELGFFGLLLTVTGVGPKVAMAIVGSRPTAELQLAIMQQDMAMLVAIPGIGKKLAERVIFELKEKVAAAGLAAGVAAGGAPTAGLVIGAGTEDEVAGALQALGYSLGEAREAARMVMRSTEPGVSLEERVKGALRLLARD
ncbi:MAG TPA: Holliday junction branch migration protein RuvA [Candidatus Limnocylindrales bacterium]|nr:Holliday junction branch migration protein RuvA [Candidatus Limnocylindrales bacterium]